MPQLTPPPLALYLHFPWCVSKCPYCDFNSHAVHGELPQKRYVDALERDIAAQAERAGGRSIVSIFMGGGTPSLFDPESIGRVLGTVRRHFRLEPSLEVTMEANPGTLERGRFAEYAAAGINRVSLGGQTFDPRILKTLGRIHSPDDTSKAAQELHAAGLSNFNIDLMYALPGQDIDGAVADIERALALAPAHLSHYQLTIEHGTVFAAAPPPLPGDDLAVEMLARCHERLSAAGFDQYEVSAYARMGRRCIHNLNYWAFGDYLGAGAGAHGKVTEGGGVFRTAQLREPRRYLAAAPRELPFKAVEKSELPFEFMLNALRLIEGFELCLFETRTGLDREVIQPILTALAARGLLQLEGERCRAGQLGLQFLNETLLAFLPERAQTLRFPAMSTG